MAENVTSDVSDAGRDPDAREQEREMAPSAAEPAGEPRLRVDGLSKSFRNVDALVDVSLEIHTGEVVGLVGENGAGKSTLLKLLTGIHQPTAGRILLDGEPIQIAGPRDAAQRGIAIVKQEQDVIRNLTGYENLYLSRIPDFTRAGVIDADQMREEAQTVVDDLGIDIDVSEPVKSYSFDERQLLEVAKAFSESTHTDHPVILLDEPTAGLEEEGRELLFDRINDLRDRASFVFVSHELDEVLEITDRIYVLKDGERVAHMPTEAATEQRLQRAMVGRETAEEYYRTTRQRSVADAETVFEVKGISMGQDIDDVSFGVRRGEIFGLVGVEGCGKAPLGRVLCGAQQPDAGTIRVDGEPIDTGSLSRMVDAGVGYIPKDRKSEGLLLYQPLDMNVSLPSIGTAALRNRLPGLDRILPLIDFDAEAAMAERAVSELDIRTPGIETLVHQLSGGNQQKVVLGKWLMRDSSILVMDNLTRGIDVGAKEEVYRVCRALAEDGVSMVFIGDELPEVIGMSNRIGIMKKGRLVSTIEAPPDDKPTEEQLIREMI